MRGLALMRLVTFETDGQFGPLRRLGALIGPAASKVIDLQIAYLASLNDQNVDPKEATRLADTSVPSQMEKLIAGGRHSLAGANQAIEFAMSVSLSGQELRGPGGRPGAFDLREVRLLAPLSRPNSLRDFIAFEDHAKAGAARRGEDINPVWYERPIYYKGNHRSLIGPDTDLPKPSFTNELDFEMEVACILGSGVRDLDEDAAAAAIFGFTVMNDWSARDVQRKEMAARLGPAKSKDFATSIGPCIVTADEVGPHPSLEMTARRNGRVICEANLGKAHWTFPKMIAFVSQGEDVWPTDIYGSGTPFGGCMLDHGGPYLQPGDVLELEVDSIGTLRNRIT